jgi:exonuclease III
MKIATFNVNGVNGRLPVLLRWLATAQPDVVCLQELKAPDEKFPEAAIREAGYNAIWRPEELERCRHPRPRRRTDRDAARASWRSRR